MIIISNKTKHDLINYEFLSIKEMLHSSFVLLSSNPRPTKTSSTDLAPSHLAHFQPSQILSASQA
jgi:hypothetical protein